MEREIIMPVKFGTLFFFFRECALKNKMLYMAVSFHYNLQYNHFLRLGQHDDMDELKKEMSRITTTKGATHFNEPLKEAISMFNNGGREKVPDVFVLFTDGKTSVEYQEAADELKSTGATMIVVGIGKSIKPDQLENIASPGYVLRVGSFKTLEDIAGRLASLVCKG